MPDLEQTFIGEVVLRYDVSLDVPSKHLRSYELTPTASAATVGKLRAHADVLCVDKSDAELMQRILPYGYVDDTSMSHC